MGVLFRWEGLGQMLRQEEPQKAPMPKGLYMHGGVGTGKTMLMDLMVESAPSEFQVLTASIPLSYPHFSA